MSISESPEVPAKVNGWRHILAAASYSGGGFRRLMGESAFRLEVVGYALIVLVFLLAGADRLAHIGAFVLFAVLVAVESLNTAVEELVDHISPEYSLMARHAKDLGSFAVFCLLCANGVWAIYVLADVLFGL